MLESEEFNSPITTRHMRVGSGGSHGMPSPLYDSSTGRGVDRIQSKDIVALMDHVSLHFPLRRARILRRSAATKKKKGEY